MPGNEGPPVPAAADGSGAGASGVNSRARALGLYYKARRLEQGADDPSALAVYLQALAVSGNGPELNARLVRLYAALGRLDEALALEEKFAADFPESPDALLTLSGFLEQHQNHAPEWKARALETARKAVSKFPQSAAAVSRLVRLYLAEQDRRKAQDVVLDALKSPSTEAGFWLALATSARNAFPLDDAASREGNFAIVSQAVERSLSLAGDDPGVLAAAADFYARSRRTDKALPLYERAAALRPGDLTARQKLGQCLRMAGREAEAVTLFESLVAIDAGDVVSHQALVSLYENTDAAKALRHRAEVLRLEGGDPRDYASAAAELLKTNLPGEALTLLKRGIFFNPQSASLLYLLARTQDAKGDFAAALQSLAEAETMARTRSPRLLDAAFYYSWAGTARKAGKIGEAENRFRQSIEKTPPEKPELAAPAYNDLGWLWLTENKNPEAAGELLRTANDLVKDHPPYLDSLGWFHFLKKDYPAALTCLRKAVELSGPNPAAELVEHLARAEAAAKGAESGQKGTGNAKE
ncbi:MAG: tetratricopeptide repeat protein [Verrucomicrobiota bacterium]